MRHNVGVKHAQKPDVMERRLLRAKQFARWQQLVYTLNPSQKPQSPWATCSTSDCHNIPTKKMAHSCSACVWQAKVANRPNTWRNADKPCKGGCGKLITRYRQHTCGASQCVKLHVKQSPKRQASRRIQKQRRRARERGAFVEDVDVMVLCEQQNRECWLCGGKIRLDKKSPHPKSLSIDHLIPFSLGGEHSYRNCAAAHLGCNSRKQANAMNEQLKLV
jgi:hypothetical protein